MLSPRANPSYKYVFDHSKMEIDLTRLHMNSTDRQFGVASSHLMQTYYTNDEDDAMLHDAATQRNITNENQDQQPIVVTPIDRETEIDTRCATQAATTSRPTLHSLRCTFRYTRRHTDSTARAASNPPLLASCVVELPEVDSRVEISHPIAKTRHKHCPRPPPSGAKWPNNLNMKSFRGKNPSPSSEYWTSSERISTKATKRRPRLTVTKPDAPPNVSHPVDATVNQTNDVSLPPSLAAPATPATEHGSASRRLHATRDKPSMELCRPEVDSTSFHVPYSNPNEDTKLLGSRFTQSALTPSQPLSAIPAPTSALGMALSNQYIEEDHALTNGIIRADQASLKVPVEMKALPRRPPCRDPSTHMTTSKPTTSTRATPKPTTATSATPCPNPQHVRRELVRVQATPSYGASTALSSIRQKQTVHEFMMRRKGWPIL
ncbi:hypothetical protein H310_00956 [Aphanomyces invadans]|uniref:Uncharacterized protein n=1 Tax=Aphanomyces invadans TaxID=157072 RepID=A0A024URV3_9STRA|nr:hypothetical protein H310_00956 [Aphanomyces invadans]ETW08358.1 hypothetical protein H310_00956 [Aphanomyces invadans]|eukprot:XP_008862163.1 hypothetical protein H310_00956 [Aphanomyces invadans]